MFTVGILTISDRSHRGVREDASGPALKECVASLDARVVKYDIVPDEKDLIIEKLVLWSDHYGIDLILTTGGTGLTPRDVTPEATVVVLDRLAPGFTDAIRAATQSKTPHAMLSRAISGVRKQSLIINMPGSPKAVREAMEVISPALPHAIETLRGEARE
ncbi:MAG: MogA/MoaB family molybdenum cofactor biosynthesis protein [Chloroflexi bacterium]|nr:MogA/MoaB family molybdenum cofactor biosynthesis protein [Chloroflexota bacterium]MBI4288345.1 MogA/MoaB family molybdenum cofactor biosynthesis protein [Chloroflexota bacterium]